MGEDRGRLAGGAHVGERRRIDGPAVRSEGERVGLDQAAQHRGGHERAAVGEAPDDVDGLVGHGAGHRGDERGDVAVAERRQVDAHQRRQASQHGLHRQLVAAVGGHDEGMAGLGAVRLPVRQHAGAQVVGPLAVVQDHERRRVRGAEGVEEGGEGVDRADLAEVVRPEVRRRRHPEHLAELRERHRDGGALVAQAVSEAFGQLAVGGGGPAEVPRHAGEHLEGPLRGLVQPLPVQAQHGVGGASDQLHQQARLAAARLGAEERDAALATPGPAHLLLEQGELRLAPHEAGFGQRLAAVGAAQDEGRLGHAPVEVLGQAVEVVGQAGSGLVALGGVAPHQPVGDLAEQARHGRLEVRRCRRHLLLEDVADPVAVVDGPPEEALDQDQPDGVEVRALVRGAGDQAGLLGCQVPHAADRHVAHVGVQQVAAGQTEVDEHGPLDRVAVDDDVRRLHVAVEDAEVVGVAQRGDHVA